VRPCAGWLLAALLAMAATACGGGSAGGGSGGTLTVDAAASLINAFGTLRTTFEHEHPGWRVVLNLGASDALAAQVEAGQRADVFAAASPKQTAALQARHLLGPTRDFATNTLVIAVPASNPGHVSSVRSLVGSHVSVVVAAPGVPLGDYTLEVLSNLGIRPSQLHIVSQGTDAETVLSALTTGAADAGFVYVTDARSTAGKVTQIPLPEGAGATAVYPIGALSDSSNAKAAKWWIDLVLSPAGGSVLRKLGFGAPPSS
jgi:molybdate transport system substrate-binding protein